MFRENLRIGGDGGGDDPHFLVGQGEIIRFELFKLIGVLAGELELPGSAAEIGGGVLVGWQCGGLGVEKIVPGCLPAVRVNVGDRGGKLACTTYAPNNRSTREKRQHHQWSDDPEDAAEPAGCG